MPLMHPRRYIVERKTSIFAAHRSARWRRLWQRCGPAGAIGTARAGHHDTEPYLGAIESEASAGALLIAVVLQGQEPFHVAAGGRAS